MPRPRVRDDPMQCRPSWRLSTMRSRSCSRSTTRTGFLVASMARAGIGRNIVASKCDCVIAGRGRSRRSHCEA